MTDMATTSVKLTVHDRCDRCGAAAQVRATFTETGMDLLFCGHHARDHIEKLKVNPAVLVDDQRP